MEVKDSAIVLHFDHLGGGLVNGSRGFAIAGEDGKFVWANSKVAGDTVVVSSPKVEHPVAARYAWSNNPDDANLYNKAGLPAVPFRTDEKGAEEEGK
jgi:sialate O-acetylesterase